MQSYIYNIRILIQILYLNLQINIALAKYNNVLMQGVHMWPTHTSCMGTINKHPMPITHSLIC